MQATIVSNANDKLTRNTMSKTGIDDLLDDLEAARVALQTILTSIDDIADNLAANRDYGNHNAVEELRELIERYTHDDR